jgi:hypothetical protein
MLALALALVGVGALQASGLLQDAIRTASAGDLAAAVCTELKTQHYSALIGQIASATDPSANQGALDPATAASALNALDASGGDITACQARQLSFVAASSYGPVANFALTIQRAHQTGPQTLMLVLAQQSDGTWKIARSSKLVSSS